MKMAKKFTCIIKKKIKDRRILYKIEWSNGSISYEPLIEMDTDILKQVEKWEIQQFDREVPSTVEPVDETAPKPVKKIKGTNETVTKAVEVPLHDKRKFPLKVVKSAIQFSPSDEDIGIQKENERKLVKEREQEQEKEKQREKEKEREQEIEKEKEKEKEREKEKEKENIQVSNVESKKDKKTLKIHSKIKPETVKNIPQNISPLQIESDTDEPVKNKSSSIRVSLNRVGLEDYQTKEQKDIINKGSKEQKIKPILEQKEDSEQKKDTKPQRPQDLKEDIMKTRSLTSLSEPREQQKKDIPKTVDQLVSEPAKEDSLKDAQISEGVGSKDKLSPKKTRRTLQMSETRTKSPVKKSPSNALVRKAARPIPQQAVDKLEEQSHGIDLNEAIIDKNGSEETRSHRPKNSIPCHILQARKQDDQQQLEFLVRFDENQKPSWVTTSEIRDKAPRCLSEYLLSRISWSASNR